MHEEHREHRNLPVSIWLLILACVIVVILSLSAGAANTGIRQAQMEAAKASLGQIETTYFYAQYVAENEGLSPSSDTSENLIQSYGDTAKLGKYERYILNAMLESFGAGRSFDFAISQYEDDSGTHTRVLFFPVKGRTDTFSDHYYMMMDGSVVENN